MKAPARRRLLQGLAAAGLGPAFVGVAAAKPAEAAPVRARLAANPLLTPLRGVDDRTGQRDTASVATQGRWPDALRGRFYRNGPALFERAGQRYHHWFDGDGMVQQFTLDGGRISHRGRLVQTSKLQAEREAGRFLFNALGTTIDGGPPITGPDSVNPANTNALEHAGRVLAMWEGGSAYGLDPADLSTQGPVSWRADLAGLPFTAHPKVDAAGHLWNIGTMGRHLLAWQIGPDGRLVKFQHGESPYAAGMVHDMAVTERYLVVPLPPVKLDFGKPTGGGPRRFAMDPGEPLRILVMDKADIRRRRVFELPPQMVFHVGNAHEPGDGTVVLSFVGAPDAWFLDRGAVALMAGEPTPPGELQLVVARLDMVSGRAQTESHAGTVEFPRIDPRRIGLGGAGAAQWLLCGAGWKTSEGRNSALLHGIQLLHVPSGRQQRFDYGPQVVAEEHVLVPKPGRSGELDAWVLGTTFDAARQATVLNLLEAADLAAGPVAQAVLPYVLPLGFHGNFTAA
jgi:carotenoid cleavage dioxygenase